MKTAIVHDYLTQYGGAERVLEALHEHFPAAPIYSSIYDPAALPGQFRQMDIRQTPLRWIPGGKHDHRLLLPLYPAAFRWLGRQLRDFDLVIASSSAWAHQAPVRPDATLICYFHSPARFLYGDDGYLDPSGLPGILAAAGPILFGALRRIDQRAARRVDHFIANSTNVADRIERSYGRTATIIYPPVNLERFSQATESTPEEWCLVVSRLVPHKRIDLAIAGCALAGRELRIVGSGRDEAQLRKIAGRNVTFLGELSDAATADLMSRCRALIVPAEEDFGLTPVEVQAAGRPAIAFGQGGVRETVIEGETGILFQEQSAKSIAAAIGTLETIAWDAAAGRRNATRFSPARFHAELDQEISAVLAGREER